MKRSKPSLPQEINQGSQQPARKRRSWHVGRSIAQVVLVILLGAGIFLSLVPLGRAFTRSALLLPALLTASQPPPLAIAGDPVRFTRLTLFPNTSLPVDLDIYEPATPPPPIPGGRSVILDVPGAGDQRSNPQLVNLSEALAREGIIDVNIGTPKLFDWRVSAQEGQIVVEAFKFMEHWPGVNPQHIGIITFCVGSLLVYEAAADPSIRDKVDFLGILGGYADINTLLYSLGTRSQVVNGHVQRWEPITTTPYAFNRTVSYLFSPSDQKLLQQAFPYQVKFPPPLPAAKVAQLSPVGAAFYHLLEGDQPANTDGNIAALSPSLKALFSQLSPLSVISGVRAPIHLLHDRNDPAMPFSQDVEMAAALARLHHPYDFAGYSIFSHVEVNLKSQFSQILGDGTKLLAVLTSIMQNGS